MDVRDLHILSADYGRLKDQGSEMTSETRLDLAAIEQRVCDIAARQLNFPREAVLPTSRLIEDLHCDSLDLIELIMVVEDEFLVTLPNGNDSPVGKAVFTRHPFRMSDLAEIVYLQQGSGRPERRGWWQTPRSVAKESANPFTQLGGRWSPETRSHGRPLLEPLDRGAGPRQFRRRSDGMRCLLLPAAEVTLGCDDALAQADEQPVHTVRLDAFLIDAEPVSTTAYCRFLNSVNATEAHRRDWFQLDSSDDRKAQMPIAQNGTEWRPVAGAELLPMVLVSWFGANAYSLWAHGSAWDQYAEQDGFLPSEAQWEYAAQGAHRESASDESRDIPFVCGQHERGTGYGDASTLRMAPVHHASGCSRFGLHHMAGNVWQWCRDWYADDFYQRPESRVANPVNMLATGVRSERGGSWVGPRELCRTTYRRGRAPSARGRCLGFRCVSPGDVLL